MLPAHHSNQQSEHIITDFSKTFERDIGLPMSTFRDFIEHLHPILNSFSYLIEHLFSLIRRAMPCQSFIVKGLAVPQTRDFYIELSDDYHNLCSHIWSVHDYRTTPQLAIYQHSINVFNEFYSHLDNLLTTRAAANGNIIVSLENFLKFKKICTDALYSYHNNCYIDYYNINNNIINNIIYMPNQPALPTSPTQCTHSQLSVSSNTKIKHQFADLIFDIKDDLSDSMYKEILEKIALVSQ